jgi:hypothetical protein
LIITVAPGGPLLRLREMVGVTVNVPVLTLLAEVMEPEALMV